MGIYGCGGCQCVRFLNVFRLSEGGGRRQYLHCTYFENLVAAPPNLVYVNVVDLIVGSVILWVRLWENKGPPIKRLLELRISVDSSPFLFIVPMPCFPMISVRSVLLSPTLAFIPPSKILMFPSGMFLSV